MTARAGEYSRLLVLLLRHTSTHLLYTNTHLPTQAISALREEHETITPCAAARARARAPSSSLLSWKRPGNERMNGLLLGDTLTQRHAARGAESVPTAEHS